MKYSRAFSVRTARAERGNESFIADRWYRDAPARARSKGHAGCIAFDVPLRGRVRFVREGAPRGDREDRRDRAGPRTRERQRRLDRAEVPADHRAQGLTGGIACEETQAGDRITFDLGDQKPGLYTVVVGYPSKSDLSAAQARAHVCAKRPDGAEQPPCHDVVRGGSVSVTKFDPAEGGRVEGSYQLELADGSVSGTFSAYRCN